MICDCIRGLHIMLTGRNWNSPDETSESIRAGEPLLPDLSFSGYALATVRHAEPSPARQTGTKSDKRSTARRRKAKPVFLS